MFRNMIDEKKIIEAVRGAVSFDLFQNPVILPENPEYPEIVTIELPKFSGISAKEAINLQNALYKCEAFSIHIHPSQCGEYSMPCLHICAYTPQMRPELFVKDF